MEDMANELIEAAALVAPTSELFCTGCGPDGPRSVELWPARLADDRPATIVHIIDLIEHALYEHLGAEDIGTMAIVSTVSGRDLKARLS